MPKDKVVILLATDLDEDFTEITKYLKRKENLLVVCDRLYSKDKENSELNILLDSFNDHSSLISKLLTWKEENKKEFSGIIGLDEEFHYSFSMAISKAFNLSFPSKDILDNTSNKYLERIIMKKAGLKMPEFRLIEKHHDLCSFPYPNVLKIITGYAGMYLYLNRDEKELKKNLEILGHLPPAQSTLPIFRPHSNEVSGEISTLDPCRQFILEEYLTGNEYSCDFMVQNRTEVTILRVIKKIRLTEFLTFNDGFYLFHPDYEPEAEFRTGDLQAVCSSISRAFGIESGVLMVDFKYSNGKINVIETSFRPGISTFIVLMAELYGYTSIDALIDLRLNLPVRARILPQKKGLLVFLTAPQQDILKSFDTSLLERNRELLGIIKICKYVNAGENVPVNPEKPYLPPIIGYVLVKNVSMESAGMFVNELRDMVRLEITGC